MPTLRYRPLEEGRKQADIKVPSCCFHCPPWSSLHWCFGLLSSQPGFILTLTPGVRDSYCSPCLVCTLDSLVHSPVEKKRLPNSVGGVLAKFAEGRKIQSGLIGGDLWIGSPCVFLLLNG